MERIPKCQNQVTDLTSLWPKEKRYKAQHRGKLGSPIYFPEKRKITFQGISPIP
jgi:hypothetical protein